MNREELQVRTPARQAALPKAGRILLAATVMLVAGEARAQSVFAPVNPVGDRRQSGLRVYGVTYQFGYSSFRFPRTDAAPGALFAPGFDFGPSPDMGGSASFGWSRRPDKKTNLAFTYTSSYYARLRSSSDLNSLNHRFTLFSGRGFTKQLGLRWTFGFSGDANVGDFRSHLFLPSRLSQVANAPAAFDDLAAAVLSGRFNNDQLASILTGAPVVEAPARVLLYGNRALAANLGTTLSYRQSSRLSMNVALSGSRYQHLRGTADEAAAEYRHLIPRSTSASASVALNYSLTQRTHLGFNVGSSRTFSGFYDGYSSSAALSLGRTLGRRWMVAAQGGAGFNRAVRHAAFAQRPHYLGGGTLGFRASSQTFMASHNRTIGDQYGLGAGSTETTSGAWAWRRPGRNWSVSLHMGRQRFPGASIDAHGWNAGASFTRTLSPNAALSTQYVYSFNSGSVPGLASGSVSDFGGGHRVRLSAVRVNLIWRPAPEGMF